jgi:SAM-dependent methyltransferase
MNGIRKIWHSLNTIFSKRNCNPIFIDIGCGPLTSGLALGQLYYDKKGEPLPINYIGIDISEAMIRKAREFSQIDFFNENTGFDFYKNWNDIPSDELQQLAGANNPFLLNASYLFANLNEDIIHDLAEFVTQLTNKYKNVHFIFQNPDRTDRNVTWELFKSKVNIKESYKGVEKIVYKTSRHSLNEPGSETVLYEIITFKP